VGLNAATLAVDYAAMRQIAWLLGNLRPGTLDWGLTASFAADGVLGGGCAAALSSLALRFAFGRSGIVMRMLAQLRIYTINRGEMDAFLQHFTEQTVPLHQQVGIPIVGMWVNRPQNEFIWVRTFADEQDRDQRVKAFQEAARAAGVQLGVNVAKMEIRETEPVPTPVLAGGL
jgi:hypothetical protein